MEATLDVSATELLMGRRCLLPHPVWEWETAALYLRIARPVLSAISVSAFSSATREILAQGSLPALLEVDVRIQTPVSRPMIRLWLSPPGACRCCPSESRSTQRKRL